MDTTAKPFLQMRRGPDFFLVGAPKCGTTALATYLGEHPEIFMARKEQHFFGSDLDEIFNIGGGHDWRLTAEEYFGMFTDGEDALRCGDASVWYLWSRRAAQEIHAYRPDALIIAMVRNPVEMLPSLHSQLLFNGVEDLKDFSAALAAEPDRRAGRRIPPNNGPHPWRLFYHEVARFHEQLERYFAVFGRERVHVVVYDDLVLDPHMTYRAVLEFLAVDSTFVPSFRVVNPNKQVRSRLVQRVVWEVCDPSSRIRRIGKPLIPVHRARSAMLRNVPSRLSKLNTAVAPRPPLDARVRAELVAEVADDVEALGGLIVRDLSHWSVV